MWVLQMQAGKVTPHRQGHGCEVRLAGYLMCEVIVVLVSHLEEQRPPVKSHPGK